MRVLIRFRQPELAHRSLAGRDAAWADAAHRLLGAPSRYRCAMVAGHLAMTLVLPLAAPSNAAQGGRPSEYEVKAAFLYNFAKFVQWPVGAFDGPSSPLVICIAGEDPFGNLLSQIVAGKTINGRRLVLERRSETADFRSCHIVFAGSGGRSICQRSWTG